MSNEPECLPEYSGHRRSDEFRSDGFQIHRGKQPRSGDAIAAGIRPEFEMEQVVPGDLDPSADGPILEAEEVFERMLWLNPSDNQGVRFLITEVREKRPWKPDL